MCSDAPEITFEDRKLWSYLRPTDPKATQMSIAAPFQFLTIGAESEWHQAVAFIGPRAFPFSVRRPLIIPQACPASTVQVRPFRRNFVSGAAVIGPQPRDYSPNDTTLSVVNVDPAQAWLHVVAYDKVPDVWPMVRPDIEYQAAWAFSSTTAKTFSCPVMGRRRFSWLAQQNAGDPGVINYRFTGLSAYDDTLREETLLNSSVDTNVGFSNGWSRHLDVDTDGYDWLTLYFDTAIAGGGSVESLFWVRD